MIWRHADAAFDSALWTAWATRMLAGGETLLLFGTRGLLGEGWDCPPVNVLVDMTAVAADVSVRQMRGRSLRLDPADPQKLASNWDVVCVAPELERGHADYGRFVRRHAHLHAPCEDGTIETGPSHVHPELSPFGPPPAERFVAINIEQQERAADRDAARARWRIGEPYRGVDLDVLVVRAPRRATRTTTAAARPAPACDRRAGAGCGRGAPTRPQLPLEWAAGAVCDAYVALGELPAAAARLAALRRAPRGLGARQPARRRAGDQPPRQRGARRAVRRRRAAALRRLAQGRRRRFRRRPLDGLARRPGRPRPPQGARGRRSTSRGSGGWARPSSSTATAPTPAAATSPSRRRRRRPSRPSAAASGAEPRGAAATASLRRRRSAARSVSARP